MFDLIPRTDGVVCVAERVGTVPKMSLSQRLNGAKSDGSGAMDAERYEALIKQLKLLSKSQASLFKVRRRWELVG